MDTQLDPISGDYTGFRTETLDNAIYLRLMTPLGSWWADKTLGSRLHELQREKDVSRVSLLARQYCEQALAPLLKDGRARSITVSTQRSPGRLYLFIEVVDAAGRIQHFQHPIKVA